MREDNVFDLPNLGAASGNLTPGAKGSEVVDLQQRLLTLGFVGLVVHGVYDEGTTEAVKYVQRALMRPDTGIVDSFTDASITRAVESAASMEGQKIAEAVATWKKVAPGVSGLFAVSETPTNKIQIVEDVPLWKRPAFWLGLAAAGAGVYLLLRKPAEDGGPPLFEPDGDGEDEPMDGLAEPDEFFAEAPKRKRKRRKKKEALAEVVEEAPDDAVEVEGEVEIEPPPPPEKAAEVAGPPEPKPRKPRKRKKKQVDGLTATVAPETGVEHGEDVDPDEDDDGE